MKSNRIVVSLCAAGLAAILSVGVGFAAYAYTKAGDSATMNVAITIGYYDYKTHLHPIDGGLYYTASNGNVTQFLASNGTMTTSVFTPAGATYDSTTNELLSCSTNSDGANTITITHIKNSITLSDGTVVHAQKLVVPTTFYDPSTDKTYHVTRFDPEPGVKASSRKTPNSLFGPVSSSYASTDFAESIAELDFGTNQYLKWIGPRAFGYMHHLQTMDLSGCSALAYLDAWSLCRSEDLEEIHLPALPTAGGNSYLSTLGSTDKNSADIYLKGAFHRDNGFEVLDFRAQAGVTSAPKQMFLDCAGLKTVILSSALTDLGDSSFGIDDVAKNEGMLNAYSYNATTKTSTGMKKRTFFYEGNGTALGNLLKNSNKTAFRLQESWPGFDHAIHCLTAESDGTTYKCATLSSKNGGNVSYSIETDSTNLRGNVSSVTANRFFYSTESN
jgi:hypothetical protein